MKLSSFEENFEDVILKRGETYFYDGHVIGIVEMDTNFYMVEVVGTADYKVEIVMENPDQVMHTDCDCPYDWGDFCKHQAAALFALRNIINQPKRKPTLKSVLSELTKDELIKMIFDICKSPREIEQQLQSTYVLGKISNRQNGR